MNILTYYQNQQLDNNWYVRFQSTAKDQCGKLFSCLNVNFRRLTSYFGQLYEFKDKDGIRREDWNNYQDNGQEKDKHRIVNLRNAGLIYSRDNRYFISLKGHEVINIYSNEELSDREKWVLLLILLMDYKTDERELDLIKSVVELVNELSKQGLDRKLFLQLLQKAMRVDNKEDLFKNDVFWLISFGKDPEFIRLYLNSSEHEKQLLHDWVINCSKDKKSKDCIAHKFVSGGAYSVSTFNEDINIILSVLIIASIQDIGWDKYLKVVCQLYVNCSYERIINFMSNNLNIYNDIYLNTFKLIIKQIK